MAVSGKIADGVIQIALKGYEAVKEQLAQVQGQLGKMKGGLAEIGAASTRGFATLTGLIVGFLKAADPVRFEIFTQKLMVLSLHIGTIFIPLLVDAIKWVDKLINFFSKLSEGQKEQILHWTKIALAVLGAGAAITKIVGMISSLWSIISAGISVVEPLVSALMKILPIGRILKLLTLGFLLFRQEGGRVGEVFGKLKTMALPVLEKLWEVVKQVFDIFKEFAGLVGEITDKIFDKIGSGLLDVFEEALPLIQQTLNAVKSILDMIGDALKSVMGVIKDAKAIYSVLKDKSLAELPGAVAKGVGRSLVGEGTSLLKSLNPFDSLDDSIDAVGDFIKDDIIGGKEDEEKMLTERAKLDDDRGSASEGADYGGGDYGGDDTKSSRFSPLAPPVRVQNFGLEEAFKKAQQGASFDPSKIAENERKRLAEESRDILKSIDSKVTPESTAASAF